jgi:hypothetical protein
VNERGGGGLCHRAGEGTEEPRLLRQIRTSSWGEGGAVSGGGGVGEGRSTENAVSLNLVCTAGTGTVIPL